MKSGGIFFYSTLAAVFAADRITKLLAERFLMPFSSVRLLGDFLRLSYVRNTGAAFSMFSGRNILLLAVNSAVVLVLFLGRKKIISEFLSGKDFRDRNENPNTVMPRQQSGESMTKSDGKQVPLLAKRGGSAESGAEPGYCNRFRSECGMTDMYNAVFGLIIAGALGNIADRLLHGYVIDFIDVDIPDITLPFYHLDRWPVFNIADSAVFVSMFFIFVSQLLLKDKKNVSDTV